MYNVKTINAIMEQCKNNNIIPKYLKRERAIKEFKSN